MMVDQLTEGLEAIPVDKVELEEAMLGGLIRSPNRLADVTLILSDSHLATSAGQTIYRALIKRWDSNKPIDVGTIYDDLRKSGDLANVGGKDYLSKLLDKEPTGALVVEYARIIYDYYVYRSLAMTGNLIISLSQSPNGSAMECLAEAEKLIQAIGDGQKTDLVTLEDAMRSAIEGLDERRINGGSSGVATGLVDIDKVIVSLQHSELTIVAGRPGVGKTSLCTSIALSAIKQNVHTLYITLEQTKDELALRILSMLSDVDSYLMRSNSLSDQDMHALIDASNQYQKLPLTISDMPEQRCVQIASHARRIKHKKDLGLVIVDYAQLVEPDDPKARRNEQVAAISRRMKLLAKELKVPVILAAQLNRDAEDREEPKLRDLKDSGGLEQDADCVILLHNMNVDDGNPVDTIQAHIAKNRNGRRGKPLLAYRKSCTRFENFEAPRGPYESPRAP